MKNKCLTWTFLLVVLSCANPNNGDLFIKKSAQETGITFANHLTPTKDLSILDYLYFYNGGGVSIGDINNDGLPDIYFSANQESNKLYLNKGDFVFEDITDRAGVSGKSSWNTGTVMVDINADGLLDIYVCAVVGLNGFNGHNELFVNQGDGTFEESAAQYGLDFESYSSNAAFLDYDLDGDLDMYLLNHAVHTQESFGKVDLRYQRSYETGDKLLRNDNGTFTDVSIQAGIYGGVNGFGLGISVADFNQDGYPDIYVGNDFHEDDYYYLNNKNGTFTESLREHFGHTSKFSMGNDAADLNHDGLPDLISLDMLPDDEAILKSTEGDDNIQVQKLRVENFGYHYQFTRNMLYINQPDGKFLETALQSGIAATDWSWSALFADFDQDGEQDLFVSNGIPKRPNDLDYINFISNENIRTKINTTHLVDKKALELMPSGHIGNRMFKGTDRLVFEDRSNSWIPQDTLVSGATAYADLDNDGDLDLVVNNLDSEAIVYENKINDKANFLKLKFDYTAKNPLGIGTKVFSYANEQMQYKELYTVRGFQSSSEPLIHFGYDQIDTVDSLKIVWPNGQYQVLKTIAVNQTLKLGPTTTDTFDFNSIRPSRTLLFQEVGNKLGINYVHREDVYTDFNRQKLIPYQMSDRGPATSIGDMNDDGKQDIFFGGSKYSPSQLYVQTDSSFVLKRYDSIARDSIKEDVVSTLTDFNGDGKNDLIIGTGGADFYDQMQPLVDSYYVSSGTAWIPKQFPELFENTSVLVPFDMDGDGDQDLFVGSHSVSADFGKLPDSYLLENKNGEFQVTDNNPFKALGMVTDAIVSDYNNDGRKDLIIVGEWMAPKFFRNDGQDFVLEKKINEAQLKGLWQHIVSFDIDGDGDQDYLLGNWGTNSKFQANKEYPMKMFYADFDKNGATETIVCTYKNGAYYPLDGLNELSSQLVSLRKKFTSYTSFAGKSITEILDKDQLEHADTFIVSTLESGCLRNDNGTFSFIPFDFPLQTAPITEFLKFDFDNDQKEEVLVGGNYFGVKPYHGRFDSFPGALIKDVNNISLGSELGLDFMFKSVRHMNIVNFNKLPYLLVTFNNEAAQVYKLKNYRPK